MARQRLFQSSVPLYLGAFLFLGDGTPLIPQ